jgi:hypothetical protein
MNFDIDIADLKKKADPIWLQYCEDKSLARQRMGDTYKKAIGWFLRFALCDLSTLSTGDWTNLRFELTSFRERGVSNEKNALAFMKGEGHVFSNYDWRDRSNPQEGLITRDEVIAFQILAREALDVIRDKRSKAFRFPSLERRLSFNPMQLILNNKMVIRASWVVQTIADDPMEALTYAMLDLLKEQANFIRAMSGTFVMQDARNYFW